MSPHDPVVYLQFLSSLIQFLFHFFQLPFSILQTSNESGFIQTVILISNRSCGDESSWARDTKVLLLVSKCKWSQQMVRHANLPHCSTMEMAWVFLLKPVDSRLIG